MIVYLLCTVVLLVAYLSKNLLLLLLLIINNENALSSMIKPILSLILGQLLLTLTRNVYKLCRNRNIVF
jgi:hypothetical protein